MIEESLGYKIGYFIGYIYGFLKGLIIGNIEIFALSLIIMIGLFIYRKIKRKSKFPASS